jgi:hypothetical protein
MEAKSSLLRSLTQDGRLRLRFALAGRTRFWPDLADDAVKGFDLCGEFRHPFRLPDS